MAGSIHLILGGARSGKSRRAETLARAHTGSVSFIATCATSGELDDEMRARIAAHVASRPAHWSTIENRFDLAAIITENRDSFLLLDCLTLWLSFLENESEAEVLRELEAALDRARSLSVNLLIVSNELGLGLVPLGAENREFRDRCGRANQLVAARADSVEIMIAGLPLKLK